MDCMRSSGYRAAAKSSALKPLLSKTILLPIRSKVDYVFITNYIIILKTDHLRYFLEFDIHPGLLDLSAFLL